MPHHISGTSLTAQARYAAGTREILECYFDQRPIRDEYLIVNGGNATGGSEEAERFKNDST
jgi:formate dehydrogenase